MFVELSDIYMEGLVHISALPSDYYHFDHASQRLVGEHTRQTFQLGDKVQVKVVRVDLDDRKIDLELVGNVTPSAGRRGNKQSAKRRTENKVKVGAVAKKRGTKTQKSTSKKDTSKRRGRK
jgi:ribonuclease R